VLDNLRKTQLAAVPQKFRPLNSIGTRNQRVTCGTYLCSMIRNALNLDCEVEKPHADCCIIKGGSCARGGKEYPDNSEITLEFLKAEMEEKQNVVVAEVPGAILRVGLRETWRNANPGWMQYDDSIEVDNDGFVITIGNKPIDVARLYRVGTVGDFFRSSDGPTIGGYFDADPSRKPDHDVGIPVHALLLEYFAEEVWNAIWHKLDDNGDGEICEDEFKALDKSGKGYVCKQSLMGALEHLVGFSTHAEEHTLVDKVMEAAGAHPAAKGRATMVLSVDGMNKARKGRQAKPVPESQSIAESCESYDAPMRKLSTGA